MHWRSITIDIAILSQYFNTFKVLQNFEENIFAISYLLRIFVTFDITTIIKVVMINITTIPYINLKIKLSIIHSLLRYSSENETQCRFCRAF